MKKIVIATVALLFMALSCGIASAVTAHGTETEYAFTPNPNDLSDLDHTKAYEWGIHSFPTIPSSEIITGARLFIDDLSNWNNSSNVLYVHLLNSTRNSVKQWTDNEGGGDYFSGQGRSLFTLRNLTTTAHDFTYNFTADDLVSLRTFFADDGKFGFGFDPDCHYYNNGVKFFVNTNTAPEPIGMALFAVGGIALAGIKRARKNRQTKG